MLRFQIIEKARSYIGTKGWTMASNWCARFAHDIYNKVGAGKYYYGGKNCDSCTTLRNYYQKNFPQNCHNDIGRCVSGDLVFYQFDKDPKADHIGIFDEIISTKKFYAVEGNTRLVNIGDQSTGGHVARRSRSMSQVMLFVHIPFEDDNGNMFPVPMRTLKKGVSGNDVKWLQYQLNTCGYDLVLDGSFGKNTLNAVLNYQHMNGLETDGKVGGATRRCLENE